MWKIAIKPGKPFALGSIRNVGAGKTVSEVTNGSSTNSDARFIGLPGNPVASFVTFLMLVRPFILAMQGASCVTPRVLHLRADFAWKGDVRREFLRARINEEGGLSLYPQQGSAVLTSCAWADGLIDNLPGQTIERGDIVRFIDFTALG